jgi:nicotinate-nucleotide adenylyltransferase
MAGQKIRHIGLFGGSFNPIHSGHLLAATAICQQLELDQVRFLPAAQSPFKDRPEVSDAHRLAMLERALVDYPAFTLDTRELSRSGPSYTIETLKRLRLEFPENRLYLIIGMDAWLGFEHWHNWQAIMPLCHLVVSSRPGYTPAPLSAYWHSRQETDAKKLAASNAGKLIFLHVPASEAASSEIRWSIAQNNSTQEFLPAPVKAYITAQGLYRHSDEK